MGQWSMHAYDADVWIPEFKGLNQADVGMKPDMRYAADVMNVATPNGILQPMAADEMLATDAAWAENRVETLAHFHRRWEADGIKDWYVCAAGGKLYQKPEGKGASWQEIQLPISAEPFKSNRWSWVTYEQNVQDATVDVLLMSNAEDGMIMVVPPDRNTTWGDQVSGEFTWQDVNLSTWEHLAFDQMWHINTVDTGDYKFGVIERYAERIWGGAIPGHPDTLVYSKPYDPTDWTIDENPEDGAGEVNQPSWDGDEFYALRRFGDHLLAFKKNRIWQVMGVSPGEFTFMEQYGDGTEYFETIAVEGERVFFAGRDGLMVYDGMSTTNYGKEAVERLWKTVNPRALDQMCGTFYKDRYYLSFPTLGSMTNNAVLAYDMKEGNILYYPDMKIETFLPTDDALYATSSSLPGQIIHLMRDSWTTGSAKGCPTKWVTPWVDFGYKRIVKGGFDFYFLPEVKDEAVEFTVSIQTEKKTKTKAYTCQPLTDEQKEAGREHKMKRLHFGGAGRKFRVIIETGEGVTAPWRLVGGIHMVVETDPD